MILYAIRHFETLHNRSGVMQGRTDVEIDHEAIDPAGIEENRLIMVRRPPTLVVSSPLVRARQTAEAYGYGRFAVDARLVEYDFGEFEGQTRARLLEADNGLWLQRFTDSKIGEGYEPFSRRIGAFLDDVSHQHEAVVIFSHGVVIRYLAAKLGGQDVNRCQTLRVDNNQLVRLET